MKGSLSWIICKLKVAQKIIWYLHVQDKPVIFKYVYATLALGKQHCQCLSQIILLHRWTLQFVYRYAY